MELGKLAKREKISLDGGDDGGRRDGHRDGKLEFLKQGVRVSMFHQRRSSRSSDESGKRIV